MLSPKKIYKKGQLVTINKQLYRVVSVADVNACGPCPLVTKNCYKPLGATLCLKQI